MASRGANRDTYLARERVAASLGRLAVVLAGRRVRTLLIIVGLLLTVWQIIFFVWRPLQQETVLPAGLAGVKAQLDVVTLENIRDERAARLQHRIDGWLEADQYFAISPSTAKP